MSKPLTALIDLDAMLHIVANVQFSAGNRDDEQEVKNHAKRFISNVCKNASDKEVIMFYQKAGHTNFRNVILPEYKAHRTPNEAILLWKPSILEVFDESGAIGLQHIESDDAQSILAEHIGYDKIVIVTGDKDMDQIPGLIYNPYKARLAAEDRWKNINVYQANRFLWKQVLAGDPTDMPGELCGIQGIGMGKAEKLVDNDEPFFKNIQDAYTNKYGKEGFHRANLTYKMVRLLKTENNQYVNPEALEEVDKIIKEWESYVIPVVSSLNIFEENNTKNLFK